MRKSKFLETQIVEISDHFLCGPFHDQPGGCLVSKSSNGLPSMQGRQRGS